MTMVGLTANAAPQTSLPISKADHALSPLRVLALAVPLLPALSTPTLVRAGACPPCRPRVIWLALSPQYLPSERAVWVCCWWCALSSGCLSPAVMRVCDSWIRLDLFTLLAPAPSITLRTWPDLTKCLGMNESARSVLHQSINKAYLKGLKSNNLLSCCTGRFHLFE